MPRKDNPAVPAIPEFVGALVKDASDVPQVELLTGFAGASPVADHFRIYLDAGLRQFVDIPRKALRHTRKATGDLGELGAHFFWVDLDVEVIYGTRELRSFTVKLKDLLPIRQVSREAWCLVVPSPSEAPPIPAPPTPENPPCPTYRDPTCPPETRGCPWDYRWQKDPRYRDPRTPEMPR